jgi:hypothetical protein
MSEPMTDKPDGKGRHSWTSIVWILLAAYLVSWFIIAVTLFELGFFNNRIVVNVMRVVYYPLFVIAIAVPPVRDALIAYVKWLHSFR